MPPILLHYYITHRCNCRCSFCDIWKMPAQRSEDAKLYEVVRNLRDARKLGVRFVDFTGGEPLLHDDLAAMLKEAKQLGLQTTVTTNGLLYPRHANALQGKIDYLHFSLDAITERKNDAVRGRPTFKAVMHSIDMARQLGEKPDLLYTVSQANVDQVKPLAEFARALGLILIVNPVFSYNKIPSAEMETLSILDRHRSDPFVYVNSAFHLLRRRGGNDRAHPRCRVMDSTIVLSPDGGLVLPCWHFQQKKLTVAEALPGKKKDANRLAAVRDTKIWRYYRKNQGALSFCQGCHLNCYFDPSFMFKIDEYFWLSLLAKSRYWWTKNIIKPLYRKKLDPRPAMTIAQTIAQKYGFSF